MNKNDQYRVSLLNPKSRSLLSVSPTFSSPCVKLLKSNENFLAFCSKMVCNNANKC